MKYSKSSNKVYYEEQCDKNDIRMIYECCNKCFGEIEISKKLSLVEQMSLVGEIANALNLEEIDFKYHGDILGKSAESNFDELYKNYVTSFWNNSRLQLCTRLSAMLAKNKIQIGEENLVFKYNKIRACIKNA